METVDLRWYDFNVTKKLSLKAFSTIYCERVKMFLMQILNNPIIKLPEERHGKSVDKTF